MLSNIILSANDGAVATKLGQVLSPGKGYWSLGTGLTQPLFEGGTLLHRTRAAHAAYDQSTAQYRSTVITAFQNVADALHAVQTDNDALQAASATEVAAARSLANAQKQLVLGQLSCSPC